MTLYLMYALGVAFVIVVLLASRQKEAIGVTERLQKVQGTREGEGRAQLRDQEEMNKSLIVRVILPLADKLTKPLSFLLPLAALEKGKKDIASAGLAGKVAPAQIMVLSYVCFVSFTFLAFMITAGPVARTTLDWAIVGIAALGGYRAPFGIIQGRAAKRKHEIQKALPFTMDLISISVEAGVAFDGAMAIVAEKTTGPLTEELNYTLNEIRLGRTRNDALADMGVRIGVDDLKSFLTAVIYISRLGGSIVDVIRIQANAMRIKRRQRAEEKAMKTPVKIMIPLVLFIFPSMFIVILGPAMIRLAESFGAVGG
jgi:tight adherence protein C